MRPDFPVHPDCVHDLQWSRGGATDETARRLGQPPQPLSFNGAVGLPTDETPYRSLRAGNITPFNGAVEVPTDETALARFMGHFCPYLQ